MTAEIASDATQLQFISLQENYLQSRNPKKTEKEKEKEKVERGKGKLRTLSMAAQNPGLAAASKSFSLSQKLSQMIAGGSLDYKSWRSLILEIETTSQDDINTISLSYDSFLSKFPLCHWHLEKYAYHKAKLCGVQEAIKIYERGAGVAMFSIGFWVDYFTFGTTCFGDPEDVRRLFGRAISYVGKDYFCHVLWDKYMNYEFNRQGWNFLAQSYIQALRFPTKKLHFYYENFNQFVANLEEETGYEKNHRAEVEQLSVPFAAIKISRDEISLVIKDMLDSSDKSLKCKALDKYRSIGEEYYQEACQLDEKIKCFETIIRRRFFCATLLDDSQLANWHLYLDFIEKQENLDWAVKLYERCLIPCANYPEFWMRYVDFLESRKGRELAISALERATQIFLKSVPEIHLFSARFKEHIGDVDGARASLLQCDTNTDSSFFEKVVAQAGLERRLGNLTAASATFEEALKTATEKQKIHILPRLYSHSAQLTFMITGSANAARDVLIDGIRQVPCCIFLFEELIKFAMTHEGASHVNIVDSIIADAVSPGLDEHDGLNAHDREIISCLLLEFVNHCGTVNDVRKAWNRHIKLFPQSIRTGATCKHSTSGSHSLNVVRDQKGRYNPAVNDQPSQNQWSVHPIQLQGEERALELPVNCQMHPSQVMEKQSPREDHNNNAKETATALSTKNCVLSNEDALWDDEPPHNLPCQSREDKPEPVDVSAKLPNQSEWNVLHLCDSVHEFSCQSRVEKTGAMDVCVDLVNQPKENALSMCESANEFGKSPGTTEPVEASCGHSSLIDAHSELDLEPKQLKQPVSLDNTFLNSKEKESQELIKESQELISMSCDEYQTKVSDLHADPEEPSRTGMDSIKIDCMVTAPGHASSGFHEQEQEEHQLQQSFSHQQHHPSNELDSKMLIDQSNAQQNLAKQNLSQAVAPANDHAWPLNTATPPSILSAGQTPLSSQQASCPQQNMQQITALSSQHPGQAHQSLAMNQLLQYHYHQQHFMQQHYQQQLHIQQPFLQLQQYQIQPQQQNQQHVQLEPQHYYVQNQQLQSMPYQLLQEITSYQQSQQQLQQQHPQQSQQLVGHQQLQHGQQPNQLQELACHVHQLGYQQHSAQGQPLLLPQYQLYQQGYQHLHQQQQSQEWHLHSQEHLHQHPDQKQQDERLQKQCQQVLSEQSLKQNMSQTPQGPKNSPLDYDGAGESSDTPHLQG